MTRSRGRISFRTYIGKYYAGENSSEVVSMGLEHFWLIPYDFVTQDEDYFRFLWDVVNN